MNEIHPAQVKILYNLRRATSARFNSLMRESELEPDAFKFHLKNLQKQAYVIKTPLGDYLLSAAGKEFANTVDKQQRMIQRQPKLSAMLVVEHPNKPLYLFQQRKRNPYFGFWGHMSGPILWGEKPEETAARELKKQTGLEAEFTIHAFYRQLDYLQEELIEDKLFTVLRATNIQGDLQNDWSGGVSKWMSLDELQCQPRYFPATQEVTGLKAGSYTVRELRYELGEY